MRTAIVGLFCLVALAFAAGTANAQTITSFGCDVVYPRADFCDAESGSNSPGGQAGALLGSDANCSDNTILSSSGAGTADVRYAPYGAQAWAVAYTTGGPP
jgi:hypothetical protein